MMRNILPIVTPFWPDYTIDIESFNRHVAFLYQNSVRGFIIGGTTGESISLDDTERALLVATLRAFAKDIEIIGCLFQSDYRSIKNTLKVFSSCDGLLVMPPMFVRQSHEDIIDFYRFISENTGQGVIIYNNPGRTKVDISSAYNEILKLPNIVGIKETVFTSTSELKLLCGDSSCDTAGRIWCGEDQFAPDFMKSGGFGIISALGNLLPSISSRITNNSSSAKDISKWGEVLSIVSKYPNPLPIKYLLYKLGILKYDTMRFPIRINDTRYLDSLAEVLKHDY